MGYAKIEIVTDALVKGIANSDRTYLLRADQELEVLALQRGVDITQMCTTPLPYLIEKFLRLKIGELVCFDKMVINPKKAYSEDVEFDSYALGYDKYIKALKMIESTITSEVFLGTADESSEFGSIALELDRG